MRGLDGTPAGISGSLPLRVYYHQALHDVPLGSIKEDRHSCRTNRSCTRHCPSPRLTEPLLIAPQTNRHQERRSLLDVEKRLQEAASQTCEMYDQYDPWRQTAERDGRHGAHHGSAGATLLRAVDWHARHKPQLVDNLQLPVYSRVHWPNPCRCSPQRVLPVSRGIPASQKRTLLVWAWSSALLAQPLVFAPTSHWDDVASRSHLEDID